MQLEMLIQKDAKLIATSKMMLVAIYHIQKEMHGNLLVLTTKTGQKPGQLKTVPKVVS